MSELNADTPLEHSTPVDNARVAGEEKSDLDELVRQWREERARRYNAIRHDASAVYSAMEKWGAIRDEEEWTQTCAEARDQYASGRFLINELGAEHYLNPALMATLWQLRQRLLDQFDPAGPAEEMLIELAVLGYFSALRVQGWIGNAALYTEHELFGRETPTAKFKQQYGYSVGGLRVEDVVERLVRELLPLLDRTNRMVIRNLKAIKDLRAPATPAVAIGQAGQVNVATQ